MGKPTKDKRRCFLCDGSGNHCNLCGESARVCECEADDWNECQSCNGTGIASADLEPADKEPSPKPKRAR